MAGAAEAEKINHPVSAAEPMLETPDELRLHAKIQKRREQLANGETPDPMKELNEFKASVAIEAARVEENETDSLIAIMNSGNVASPVQKSDNSEPAVIYENLSIDSLERLENAIAASKSTTHTEQKVSNNPDNRDNTRGNMVIYINNSTVNIYN